MEGEAPAEPRLEGEALPSRCWRARLLPSRNQGEWQAGNKGCASNRAWQEACWNARI